jgi:hypothetical protein
MGEMGLSMSLAFLANGTDRMSPDAPDRPILSYIGPHTLVKWKVLDNNQLEMESEMYFLTEDNKRKVSGTGKTVHKYRFIGNDLLELEDPQTHSRIVYKRSTPKTITSRIPWGSPGK